MMKDSKIIWIETGYENYATSGLNGLKIEPLAKQVCKNKSSFYHHFADPELFFEELLTHHLQQSKIIAEKERSAKNINPELIDIIVDHKIDILFNRQLRINRNKLKSLATLEKSNEIIGTDFVKIWIKDLNLKITEKQLESIFELALENFYLKVNFDNLNHHWLREYFNNLRRIISNFVPPD